MLEELEQSCFDTPGWDHPWHSCLLLFFFFYCYQQWSHFDWRHFSGDTVVKNPLEKYLDCFTLSCFSQTICF